MSDTPLSDAAACDGWSGDACCVSYEVAQEIERLIPKWQPIEAAPRDGAGVLGFMPSYYQGSGGQSVIVWMNGNWYDNRAFITTPTHWMPLPPPPSEAGPDL